MKKIFVTGATGFIGNYVLRELLGRGFSVISSSGTRESAKHADWYKRSTYIPFDLKQFDPEINYYDFFQQPDIMIHLAWEGLPNYTSSFHIGDNLPRHVKFLTNLVKNGLSNLTVTGTCLEYGMQEGSLREDMPVSPSNPYAIA